MQENLKASLEWLKDCAENGYIFETGDSKLLLDYITNLQEENKRLKDYKSRINNAIEYINNHWDLATDKNVEFCILRDRVYQILKRRR